MNIHGMLTQLRFLVCICSSSSYSLLLSVPCALWTLCQCHRIQRMHTPRFAATLTNWSRTTTATNISSRQAMALPSRNRELVDTMQVARRSITIRKASWFSWLTPPMRTDSSHRANIYPRHIQFLRPFWSRWSGTAIIQRRKWRKSTIMLMLMVDMPSMVANSTCRRQYPRPRHCQRPVCRTTGRFK